MRYKIRDIRYKIGMVCGFGFFTYRKFYISLFYSLHALLFQLRLLGNLHKNILLKLSKECMEKLCKYAIIKSGKPYPETRLSLERTDTRR